MKQLKRTWIVLIAVLFLFPAGTVRADEEIYYADIPLLPSLQLLTPKPGEGCEAGNKLLVSAKGSNVSRIEVTLSWDGGSLTQTMEGDAFEYTFQLPALKAGLSVNARGYGFEANGKTAFTDVSRDVPSPKEALIGKMIALAYDNSKDSRYKFAPAEEDYDIGVCKNFVMRLFDTYSKDYSMQAYPDLPLHMPKNNSKAACAPYDYGIEWRPETAQDGSPFEIVAQFKYNNDLSKEENAAIAFNMLKQVKRGDFFQMVGYYGGGNGPHSLLFITDYDPVSDMLHWTDSNMRGKRIDGVRWGYLQYDADATAHWFIECINTKKRGATLYRLRDDLIRK